MVMMLGYQYIKIERLINMKDLVVKDNALIQASFNFSLAEQRLILLAIVEARETGKGIDDKTMLSIHASKYSKQFDTDSKTAYKVLKSAGDTLKDKVFRFMATSPTTGRLMMFEDKWLNRVGYEDNSGYIHFRFSEAVVPLITRLGSNFTSYEIQKIVKLTSSYAIRLYELLIQWKQQGTTQKFLIEDLRSKLGVEPEQYKELHNLKVRVIDLAVKQINQHTDLIVSYEQHKEGRTVVAFTFNFKFKKPENLKDIQSDKPTFIKFTDKQLATFSNKLANLPALGSEAPIGGTLEQFTSIIAKDLQDESKQKKYHKHLDAVGYKAS